MAIVTQVSVEEYLHTVYRPDCDYVDGELEERNLGQTDHSRLQKRLTIYLGTREQQYGIVVFPEQRVQLSVSRFRVPDLCVLVGSEPTEAILTTPPLVCIEILSPDDRMSRVNQRIEDYLVFGVRYVWVIDPATKAAYAYTQKGMHQVTGLLRTENPTIEVPLAALFD